MRRVGVDHGGGGAAADPLAPAASAEGEGEGTLRPAHAAPPPLAAAVSAVALALAGAGCGDSASIELPAARQTAPVSRAAPREYGGLGAPSAAFARNHRESPRGRGPGQPFVFDVKLDPAGRVQAFTVEFNDKPPLSDYERLVSATGVSGLPRDHRTVATATECLVYGSPMLEQLLGAAYARVTTLPGAATATVLSVSRPTC